MAFIPTLRWIRSIFSFIFLRMQTPEVWNFSAPPCHVHFQKGNLKDTTFTNVIDLHYLNHLVSVTIPGKQNHDRISRVLEEDNEYYRVENIDVSELIRKEFIEAFVKRGQLTVLSDGKHVDTDDCLAITPSGHLVLSLQRQTYQELGIEGKASLFSPKKSNRFVVDLDLLAEQFTPDKKHYERVGARFADVSYLRFNLLLTWEPADEQVCPSSIAAYLHSRGYCVTLCRPQFQQRHDLNVSVPLLGLEDEGKSCSSSELLEWLGAYSIGVDLQSNCSDDYLSSYQCPTENQLCDKLVNLQWTGFFTSSKIKKLFDEIRCFITMQQKSPWASIHVQGFADSPINWGLKEHHFYLNGDNNYTIFIRPDNLYLICSFLSSNKRPRKKGSST